jgi:transcriptional regulator with XRE-family HTH domain
MRMRQSAAGSRDARSRGPASRGHDPQIAHFFRNMRTATRLSRDAIARRLATTPATIESLELGAVSALPHWPETVRIVRGYCDLLRLDPEPLLWRIQQLLRAGDDPPPSRPVGPPPPALRKERPQRASAPRRRRRGLRKLMIMSMPPVVVAGLLYAASTAPAPLYRLLPLLPPAVAESARAALDTLVLYSAPRRNRLRWIDVGDPRVRKVDKLPTKRR